jgi:uncharacterized protein
MRKLLTALIAVIALWGSNAYALDPPPNYGQWVVDNAKLFTRAQRLKLSYDLRSIQRKSGGAGEGAQVAVLTMKSLEGDDIKDFALRTFRAWELGAHGAGSQGKSNGVLILIVKDSGQVRIEVGTGLEGALNDGTVRLIIRNRFGSGLSTNAIDATRAAVSDIASKIYAEYRVTDSAEVDAEPEKAEPERINGDARLILFGVSIFIAGILGAVFHRRRRMLRYWFGGVVGGTSWGLIAASYTLSGLALAGVAALGYILGYFLAALFRHGGDGWLFDPFPRFYGVGGSGSEGLHGGGGDAAGGGADGMADAGLFDGAGDALSNAVPAGDCPTMDGCDAGGCDIGGCG